MQHILGKIWGEATCHDHRVEDEELRLPSGLVLLQHFLGDFLG
jgi:hypothetical protein